MARDLVTCVLQAALECREREHTDERMCAAPNVNATICGGTVRNASVSGGCAGMSGEKMSGQNMYGLHFFSVSSGMKPRKAQPATSPNSISATGGPNSSTGIAKISWMSRKPLLIP